MFSNICSPIIVPIPVHLAMSRRHRKCNRGKWRRTHESNLPSSLSSEDSVPSPISPTDPLTVVPSTHQSPLSSQFDDEVDSFGVFEDDLLIDNHDSICVVPQFAHNDDSDSSPLHNVPMVSKADLSIDQVAMLDIMILLDGSGANRGLYNELIKLLRKHTKAGFNPMAAQSREKFIEDMRRKVHVPDPIVSTVRGRSVFRLPLRDMMQDLLLSRHFDSTESIHVNRDTSGNVTKFVPRSDLELSEVMSCKWASDTFDEITDYDPSRDLLLPLILYADKTGSDHYQRYPLEPWMFTFGIFSRSVREKSDAWRHLGFIPPIEGSSDENLSGDYANSDNPFSSDDHCNSKAQENIQSYHDYLSELLIDLKDMCVNKPEMRVNLGGSIEIRRLHVCVAIIIGDQKSQDYVCGRKSSNNGSSGRVHRGCMCSGIRGGDATDSSCSSLLNVDVVSELNKIALMNIDSLCSSIRSSLFGRGSMAEEQMEIMMTFVERSVCLARSLLAKPYTLHPLRNAFEGVSFGANRHGVFVATAEDHLHSAEAGVIDYINQVAYGFMSQKERTMFQEAIRIGSISKTRSSARKTMPVMKMKHNFTSQSLMTHSEKVGCLLNLRLSLDNPECRLIWEKAHHRQKMKYVSFPTRIQLKRINAARKKPSVAKPPSKRRRKQENDSDDDNEEVAPSNFPFRKDKFFFTDRNKSHPFPRTETSISFMFRHLIRHGFEDLLEEDAMDELQVDQFCTELWSTFQPIEHLDDDVVYPSRVFVEKVEDPGVTFLFRNTERQCGKCKPTPLEMNCCHMLRHFKKRYDSKKHACQTVTQLLEPISFSHCVRMPHCVHKHLREKPKVRGKGYTGAILAETKTFIAFIEFVLCYHAWCHHSYLLPEHVLNDTETVDFGTRLLVQYFDTIVYRGDSTTDSDTCKIHSQLHVSRLLGYFGDLMQYNSSTGERGLKDWANRVSRTARKQGIDAFTEDTTKRVCETILLKRLSDAVLQDSQCGTPTTLQPTQVSITFTRKRSHFVFHRNNPTDVHWVDIRKNRDGDLVPSSEGTGTVPQRAIDALLSLEPKQESFHIWCEGKLPDDSYIRCFPNYHSNQGPWYDWVGVTYPMDDGSSGTIYPSKLIALYTDINDQKKALVHSVCTKTLSSCEGKFGDTKLVQHYRKEFDDSGYPMLRVVPANDIKWNLITYESEVTSGSLFPPRTIDPQSQREHTVMVIRPRQEWAQLFIDWTKEVRNRRNDERGIRRNCLV